MVDKVVNYFDNQSDSKEEVVIAEQQAEETKPKVYDLSTLEDKIAY